MANLNRVQRILTAIRRRPILSGLIALGTALLCWSILVPRQPSHNYLTEAVTMGEVHQLVQASGNIRALNTINVGSEISGQVSDVFVDFNTRVRRGQLLAQIDSIRPRSRVLQAEASVRSAQAALARAEAARSLARTQLDVQRRDFGRRNQLADRGFVARSSLDQSLAALASAQAAVEIAEAGIVAARAGIAQAQADLATARLDLSRTRIVAPAAGVVINKLVEPGTTVAASFQTPNLFEIAADTNVMQVEASVDEADIGQVRVGQHVDFTVDAHADETFRAVVRQIRQAPTQTEKENAVSYLAILDVANPQGKLLPGMTANVEIVTGVARQVLRVPTSAVRFRPAAQDLPGGRAPEAGDHVWVATADPHKPARRRVIVGLRGEEFVEIRSGLKVGERVLVRQRSLQDAKEKEQ